MDDHQIEELLRRIEDLEARLEERGQRPPHHRPWERRREHGERWPPPPPPPRHGQRDDSEKRIVDLVVALVTERVEHIVAREIDRAIAALKPPGGPGPG